MELIPERLRQAHEDGEVVFFCGAGVSVPAGLPSFKSLVEEILQELAPDMSKARLPWKAFQEGRFDEALDILERHEQGGFGQEVRTKVRDLLTKKSRTLNPHMALARLADLDKPEGRIVTTNFDWLFERAVAKLCKAQGTNYRKPVSIAPSLPPPKAHSWDSLVYLHGKLDHSSGNKTLVLTTADFGAAYLLDHWAGRFVTELFRNFHVVFIGYRIEDPTMRYLVSALAAARGNKEHYKEAFAFAPYGDGNGPETDNEVVEAWRIKGVQALPYDSAQRHRVLWQTLQEWADDHRGGLLSRRRLAAQYGKQPPTGKTDAVLPKLAWALRDRDVARHFSQQTGADCPDAAWIPLLQDKGLFDLPIDENKKESAIRVPLVARTLPDLFPLHPATLSLGEWIAQCLDRQETLDWVLAQGGVLHWRMRLAVRQRLAKDPSGAKPIPGGLRKIWQVLASDYYAQALSAKNIRLYIHHPRLSPSNAYAKRTFLDRLRPIPIFTKKADIFRDRSPFRPEEPSSFCEIKVHLVGIEGEHDIDQVRSTARDFGKALAIMAHDITTLLHEAMDWQGYLDLATAEQDSTYIELRSISAHEQNRHAKTWTQLIQLVRESFDVLKTQDKAAAERLAFRWRSLNYPIFRRLALYAYT